jgi:hypothetical protein
LGLTFAMTKLGLDLGVTWACIGLDLGLTFAMIWA